MRTPRHLTPLTIALVAASALLEARALAATPSASKDEGARHAAASGGTAEARIAYSAAYFGEFLLHPGVLAGVEYRLATHALGSVKGTLLVAPSAGTYVHPRNHVGVLVDGELAYRFTFGSGLSLEARAGVGYLHTFLAAPVYSVTDTGDVERITDAGRPALMPVVGIGAGWQLGKVAPFLRVEGFGQYPYNERLLPHVALVLGARV